MPIVTSSAHVSSPIPRPSIGVSLVARDDGLVDVRYRRLFDRDAALIAPPPSPVITVVHANVDDSPSSDVDTNYPSASQRGHSAPVPQCAVHNRASHLFCRCGQVAQLAIQRLRYRNSSSSPANVNSAWWSENSDC